MTKDEAQRSIRTFYEAANDEKRLLTEVEVPSIFCRCFSENLGWPDPVTLLDAEVRYFNRLSDSPR
jgi:hypothetical protein